MTEIPIFPEGEVLDPVDGYEVTSAKMYAEVRDLVITEGFSTEDYEGDREEKYGKDSPKFHTPVFENNVSISGRCKIEKGKLVKLGGTAITANELAFSLRADHNLTSAWNSAKSIIKIKRGKDHNVIQNYIHDLKIEGLDDCNPNAHLLYIDDSHWAGSPDFYLSCNAPVELIDRLIGQIRATPAAVMSIGVDWTCPLGDGRDYASIWSLSKTADKWEDLFGYLIFASISNADQSKRGQIQSDGEGNAILPPLNSSSLFKIERISDDTRLIRNIVIAIFVAFIISAIIHW